MKYIDKTGTLVFNSFSSEGKGTCWSPLQQGWQQLRIWLPRFHSTLAGDEDHDYDYDDQAIDNDDHDSDDDADGYVKTL